MAVFPAEVPAELDPLLGDVRDLMALVAVVVRALVIAAALRAVGGSRWFVVMVVGTGVAVMPLAGAVLGLVLGRLTAPVLSWPAQARTAIALPVAIGAAGWRLVTTVASVGLVLAAPPATLACRHRSPRACTQRDQNDARVIPL